VIFALLLLAVEGNVVRKGCFQRGDVNSNHLLGEYVPKCNLDGTFKEVQCHEGSCFCVNKKTGDKVDGKLYKGKRPRCGKEQTCLQASARVQPLLGAFRPKCDKDGNYKEMQCHEQFCFCVDKSTGKEILMTRRLATQWNDLPTKCSSDCVQERHKKLNFAATTGLLGIPTPTCTDDGSYAKKQCFKNMCWEPVK